MKNILIASAIAFAATALFVALLRPFSSALLDVALRPEVRAALEKSLADQKRLRAMDPAHESDYRKRFEDTQRLVNRIDVVRMNRDAVLGRVEAAITAIFITLLVTAAFITWRRSRAAEIARRKDYVDRFAAWQSAARRHAHEIKMPLTAARLEVDRLMSLTKESSEELTRAAESVFEELDRLARFTREFSSFAAVAQPVPQREELNALVDEFCTTFRNAWPNLELEIRRTADTFVAADRDLVRQVLANLCANSARATGEGGRIAFTIERDSTHGIVTVADNGSGISDSIRARVFDPYVTTRNIGEGMGLGLAISRKIMLDHGGDLQLAETSAEGTTFRLMLPVCR
jgi:signal transduction histidine kinase